MRSKRRVLTLVAAMFVTSAVWSGPADAQRPRYSRDTQVKVKVKQTEKTKKMEAKKQGKSEIKPQLSADDIIAVQGQVKHIRNQQVQLLEQLISDTPDSEAMEKADLLFRLAELHAQLQRYWNFRGMEMHAKVDKAPKSQKSSLRGKQKRYFAASKKALLDAVKVYKRLADSNTYKNYPRMDEALFYYAYTLQGAKYMKEARKVFHRLIKDYPNSKYIPEAYLAFADYYFAQNSLANAEQFYNKVLQFPKAKVYDYALYKKGWVYLNLDQPQDALETFYKVAQRTKGNKEKAILNKASKKDFVRAYAEVGKAEKAYQAFQRVDKGYAFNMLQILGDIYLEQGQAPKSIFVMREMIGLKPKHKQVCEWQYNVVHAYLTVGSKGDQVNEIKNLVKLYDAYRDKKILPESNLDECRENATAVTSEMAKIWHSEANKTLDFETLGHADDLYRVYLDHFPQSEEFGEMQYYHAELLWKRAENEKNQRLATELWERAAVAFTDVVKAGKVDDKLRKESAYAAVLGWKNALAVDPRTKAPPPTEEAPDKVPEPKEIPEREQKMISAFDIYIDYIKDPKDEELVMMKFLKARIYWRYNQFESAIPLFEDIVEKHIDHETAEYSANLLLDTLNRTKKYDQMIKWVDRLLKQKSFLEDKEDLAERLEVLKRTSLRKAAEQLESQAKETGDFAKYVECGKAYIEIFNRDPEGEGSDEVLYNAGVCFEEGKSIGAAISMFELLSKRFPDSNATKRAVARLGANYGRIAWYDEAASKLEEYARRFGGEKDAYEALSDAVFYRKGIGDDKKALDDTEFFIKKYRKSKVKEAAAALWSMTSIYEKQGDNDKVVDHLRRYLREFGARGGVDRQIVAYSKIGQILWEQSCPVKGVNGACIKVTRERAIASKRKRRRSSSALPTQCGPESKIKLTLVRRDDRKVREAQQAFKQAVKLFAGGRALEKVPGDDDGEKGVRRALATKYFAGALFFLNEEQYEDFLSIDFPTKLDFDPRNEKTAARSKKRFKEWLEKKIKVGGQAREKYQEIINISGGDAHYAIAAATRIGQIQQNFSDALFTAEIPRDVRTGQYAEDKVDAYCDALMTEAQPLEDKSVEAFSFCLETSTKLNWFNEWSQLCEKELGQIRPQDFPTAAELRGEPNKVAAVIDREKPVLELEQ